MFDSINVIFQMFGIDLREFLDFKEDLIIVYDGLRESIENVLFF